MADGPLIFVEVALTKGVPNSIQDLLADARDEIAAEEADTAVFYSISNCQAGLAGISFGKSLIKQVVSDLAKDLGNLSTFVTLSPIRALPKIWHSTCGFSCRAAHFCWLKSMFSSRIARVTVSLNAMA